MSAGGRHSLLAAPLALILPAMAVSARGEGNMHITSSAFTNQGAIPVLYTCEGQDVSPPMAWSDVPPGTKSLVLIVDDPDAPDPAAPKMTWVHWVLYNLPPTANGLPERVKILPEETREGADWAPPVLP
jgi:phosphatidylethanolamine-binding protein (PEBP) family uncharacterized protein